MTIGDIIEFGRWPQKIEELNTPEEWKPIEWIVLDEIDGLGVLVISKYALDAMQFDPDDEKYLDYGGGWGTSALREWLNGEFLEEAFESYDQLDAIVQIAGWDNKVFLLDAFEVMDYFVFDFETERNCVPTEYAVNRGAEKDMNGNCWWWLRSPGDSFASAQAVDPKGHVISNGIPVDEEYLAVRPAMWIKPITAMR